MKHTILNISYPSRFDPGKRDWLQCICGWEGVALDLKPYYEHKKTAPPVEEGLEIYAKPYTGTFIKRLQV